MASAASRSAAELCGVLLDNFFGPTIASVARILLLYGRLEAATISRRAEVSPRLTRQSLVVLIQHNFARFSSSSEGGQERTFYECNWKEIFGLLQTGQLLWWASHQVSAEGAALVKYVSIYGKVKAGDLTSAFSSAKSELHGSSKEFAKTMLQLVQAKILRVAYSHEVTAEADFKQSIRDEMMASMKGLSMPESRKVKEVEQRLQQRLKSLQDTADSQEGVLKRKSEAPDSGRARKRARTEVGDGTPELSVDPEVMLRVNHDKFAVFQRNEELVKLCQKRLGPTPGAVYRHVLQQIEPRIFSCRQDTRDIIISTLTISRALPDDLDLHSVWSTETPAKRKGTTKRKQKTKKQSRSRKTNGHRSSDIDSEEEDSEEEENSEDDSEDEDIDGLDDDLDSFVVPDMDDLASDEDYDPSRTTGAGNKQSNERVKDLNRFLELFSTDSLQFLRKVGSRSMGEWHVDYPRLAETLRQVEIEALIRQKLGDVAPRLLRIVQDKVKVDEKQLSTTALLKQKDIRHVLTALHSLGVLDLQEVPKRLDRQPSMTYFLWCHNHERAISSLSQDLCKAMARVHQRLRHELRSRRRLLDKSQRTDVRNKEAEYLSKGELAELRKVRAVEEKLLAQSMRLARSYAILVDY